MAVIVPTLRYERRLWNDGHLRVAGVDEVGVAPTCASVVAKVVRDRMMTLLAVRYPGYGWEHNQGYATRDHRDAIRALGLTPFHRRSFLALQRTLAGDQLAFDLLADPNASEDSVEILEREAIPVMADDAMLDMGDLMLLEAPVG